MTEQIKLSVLCAIIDAAKMKLNIECASDTSKNIDLKKYALDIVDAIEAANSHAYLRASVSTL